MTCWRHDLHEHREPGFEEERTSARVAELLRAFGLQVHTGTGKTGAVGVLQKGNGTNGSNAHPLPSADYDFNDGILTPGSSYGTRLVEQEPSSDAA